jgi:hypothetical protein
VNACAVRCNLPHGLVIEHAGERITLRAGVNDPCDRTIVEGWLARNRNLRVVKVGDVKIVERRARDIGAA